VVVLEFMAVLAIADGLPSLVTTGAVSLPKSPDI
jgi:hypothetical protein